jgi:hypothetical protein
MSSYRQDVSSYHQDVSSYRQDVSSFHQDVSSYHQAEENMAALFTVREKNKKGLLGPYIGVFRVVIS